VSCIFVPFFLVERPALIYSYVLLLVFIKGILGLSITYYIATLGYWGINLVIYDNLGSFISENKISLGLVTLLSKGQVNPNMVIRHVSAKAITALVIGKTPMTVIGRATLIVAAVSGAGYLVDNHFARLHDAEQQGLNREMTHDIANKKLDFENKKLDFEMQKYEASQNALVWWPFNPK